MRYIGFSTGAVAFGNFRHALELVSTLQANAVELSALRLNELEPLIDALDDLDLKRFSYISFHAPSKFSAADESKLVESLKRVADRHWPIIVHPDSVFDDATWKPIEKFLCFENMDKRKPIGRTAGELASLFRRFPNSSLCFDIGHAHQVDRTMSEGRLIAQQFGSRIKQIHVSEVNTRSQHVGLSAITDFAFSKVTDLLSDDTPIIIESVLPPSKLEQELKHASEVFDNAAQSYLERNWG